MRLEVGWFQPLRLAAQLLSPRLRIPVSTFNDYTKTWYFKVGLSMIITRSIDIVFPSPFVNNFRAWKHRKVLSKLKKFQEKKLTIFELKKKLQTKSVDFGFLIARVNLAMLLTMVFSSGVPLLIPLTFFFYLTLYITTKKYFVRYSLKPAYMNESLVEFSLKVATISNIFHFINGLIAYSQKNIFPPENQYNFFGKIF